MTLSVITVNVNTGHGVAISVTGIAQVGKNTQEDVQCSEDTLLGTIAPIRVEWLDDPNDPLTNRFGCALTLHQGLVK